MFRNACTVFIILALFLGLSACGKKEEVEEAPAVTETEAPEIVPGEMVFVPAGDFIMGSDDPKSDGYPKHTVNLPAYWIDKYEVTNAEYLDFSLKTGYQGEGAKEGKDWRIFFTPATPEKAMIPVVYITWNDATAYCKSLGKRLPTEEEWEKAAIVDFYTEHSTDGYRRVAFMMLDADIVAVSPSTVYRVLRNAGVLGFWNRNSVELDENKVPAMMDE